MNHLTINQKMTAVLTKETVLSQPKKRKDNDLKC